MYIDCHWFVIVMVMESMAVDKYCIDKIYGRDQIDTFKEFLIQLRRHEVPCQSPFRAYRTDAVYF